MFLQIQDCTTFGSTEFLRRLLIKLSDGRWPFGEHIDIVRKNESNCRNVTPDNLCEGDRSSSDEISDYTTLFSQPETSQEDESAYWIEYMNSKNEKKLKKIGKKYNSGLELKSKKIKKAYISSHISNSERYNTSENEHKLKYVIADDIENQNQQIVDDGFMENSSKTRDPDSSDLNTIQDFNEVQNIKDFDSDQLMNEAETKMDHRDSKNPIEPENSVDPQRMPLTLDELSNRNISLNEDSFLFLSHTNQSEMEFIRQNTDDLISLDDSPGACFDTLHSQGTQPHSSIEFTSPLQDIEIESEKHRSVKTFGKLLSFKGSNRDGYQFKSSKHGFEQEISTVIYDSDDKIDVDNQKKGLSERNTDFSDHNQLNRKENLTHEHPYDKLSTMKDQYYLNKNRVYSRNTNSYEQENALLCHLERSEDETPSSQIPKYNLRGTNPPNSLEKILVIAYRPLLLHPIISLKERPINILILDHNLLELSQILEKYSTIVLFKLNSFDMSCLVNMIRCRCIAIGKEGEKLTCRYGVYYLGPRALDL